MVKPTASQAMPRRNQHLRENDPDGLDPRERKFVDLYLICRDAPKAYFETYRCAQTTARKKGSQKLKEPHIKLAAARGMHAVSQAAGKMAILAAQDVLEDYTKMAKADPRELVDVAIRSCRYCWGKDHRYQFTARELEQARRTYELKVATKVRAAGTPVPEFDELGGAGFNPVKNAPNPDCPECFGEGVAEVRVKGTANLTPEAARLYAGAKQTRDGIVVNLHPQTHALDRLGEHHGLWKPDGGDDDTADSKAEAIRRSLAAMDEMTFAAG